MIYREVSPQQKAAVVFLKNVLADGAKVPVTEIRLKAETANVSYHSLRSAKKILNVEVSSNSYFKFWQLPNDGK